MHINLITIVAYLTAAALSASRILVATRPAWQKLPATFQIVLPLAIPALAMLVQELAGVKTGVDLTTAIIGAVLMAVPGLPSNRSAAKLQEGKSPTLPPSAGDIAVAETVIAKRSIRPLPLDESESTPPHANSINPGPFLLLLAIGFAFHAQGCAAGQTGACDPADAVRITEKYRASMSVQCKGFTLADCPHRDELEAQRDKELEAACSK